MAVRSVKTTPSVEFRDRRRPSRLISEQGPDGGAYSRASDLATCAYLRTHFEDVWATSEIGGHEIVFEDVVAPSPDAYRTEIRGLSVDTWDRVIAELAAIPSRLHSMNGRAFEELVAELLNRDGNGGTANAADSGRWQGHTCLDRGPDWPSLVPRGVQAVRPVTADRR